MQVLGIDQWNGSVTAVQSFGAVGGATFPLLTQGGSVGTLYGVDRQYVIVDQAGVVQLVTGQHSFNADQFHTLIGDLLGNNSAPEVKNSPAPSSFSLVNAWPNPFNGAVRLTVSLPNRTPLRVQVLDLLGREVAELQRGALGKGNHTFVWQPAHVASGVYLFRVQDGAGVSAIRRVVFLK